MRARGALAGEVARCRSRRRAAWRPPRRSGRWSADRLVDGVDDQQRRAEAEGLSAEDGDALPWLDALVAHARAVDAAEVLDLDAVAEVQPRVLAGDRRVVDPQVALLGAPEHDAPARGQSVAREGGLAHDDELEGTGLTGVEPWRSESEVGAHVVEVEARARRSPQYVEPTPSCALPCGPRVPRAATVSSRAWPSTVNPERYFWSVVDGQRQHDVVPCSRVRAAVEREGRVTVLPLPPSASSKYSCTWKSPLGETRTLQRLPRLRRVIVES